MDPASPPAHATAAIEGRVDIALLCHGGLVAEVQVVSTRPQIAQRLLVGRTPAQAADLAGLLFSLCGRAQAVASAAAAEAALGTTPSIETQARRTRRILIELALEHVRRLLIDGPRQAGRPPALEAWQALAPVVGHPERFAAALEDVVQIHLLGEPATAWLAHDLATLDRWRRAQRTLPATLLAGLENGADRGISLTPLLPSLPAIRAEEATALGQQMLDRPESCARPEWAGIPAETGAVARMADEPLLATWLAARGLGVGARQLARLAELARLPERLRSGTAVNVRAWPLAAGGGVAGVETARGLLLHAVRLEGGVVADYRILAPTEWNFHPQGAIDDALSSLPVSAHLAEHVAEVVLSLDPCVEYGVEIVYA